MNLMLTIADDAQTVTVQIGGLMADFIAADAVRWPTRWQQDMGRYAALRAELAEKKAARRAR